MRFDLIDEPAAEVLGEVLGVLRTYNREQNGAFFAARDLAENAPRPMHVIAYDDGGAIAGGVIGESQFAWMKVEILVVRQDRRGLGTGRELMRRAEEEALRRGCRYVLLDTMSYQAPEFYRKLGYRVAGEMADWDSHGHTKYYFVKTLCDAVGG